MNKAMKQATKAVLYAVGAELFDMAKELGLLMGEIMFTPYGQLRIHKIPRSTYYDRIRKYERQGLIRKVRKSYGNAYILTEKAKHLRKLPLVKINRNDGFSTLIIFDIPEEKHKARDNFRRYLIKQGYTQIQKSAFISPFKVSDQLKDFIHELGLSSNITLFAAKTEQL